MQKLRLVSVHGSFAICRLGADSEISPWMTTGPFYSITVTVDELSVVCSQDAVPEGVACERGWRSLRVAGTIPLSAVGVLAALITPLAAEAISIFAVSTFDTDYLLVKEQDYEKAVSILQSAGHSVG
jgi:hypothetical protein